MPPAPTYLTRANAPLPRTRRTLDRDVPKGRLFVILRNQLAATTA